MVEASKHKEVDRGAKELKPEPKANGQELMAGFAVRHGRFSGRAGANG